MATLIEPALTRRLAMQQTAATPRLVIQRLVIQRLVIQRLVIQRLVMQQLVIRPATQWVLATRLQATQ